MKVIQFNIGTSDSEIQQQSTQYQHPFKYHLSFLSKQQYPITTLGQEKEGSCTATRRTRKRQYGQVEAQKKPKSWQISGLSGKQGE